MWLRYSAVGILAMGLAGCQGSLPATVSGEVTIEGQAVDSVVGEVMFHPAGGGAMAMAPLESDGSYSISLSLIHI